MAHCANDLIIDSDDYYDVYRYPSYVLFIELPLQINYLVIFVIVLMIVLDISHWVMHVGFLSGLLIRSVVIDMSCYCGSGQ